MPSTNFRATLADRLLTEQVRQREERQGFPDDCPAADSAAIRHGGDFSTRVQMRARHLPGSDTALRHIARLLTGTKAFTVGVIALAALSGFTASATALGATQPASLPLVLLVVVGLNLLTLLLWLLSQGFTHRLAGLGALLRTLWQRIALRASGTNDIGANREALRTLLAAGSGRWLFASLVHAAWLAFGVGAMLALLILLSVRAYELTWATTLLSADALAAWARLLSFGPQLIGIESLAHLDVTDTARPEARQAWSYWLLVTSGLYGVLPRAIALGFSLWRLQRATAPLGRDMQRPGYARLRTRLMPDHAALGVVDRAPQTTPSPVAAPIEAHALQGRMHGLALEYPADPGPPPSTATQWTWLGVVDDAASRENVLHRLRETRVDALAIRLRATLTPDRGLEHFIGDLVAATQAPVHLVLDDTERLHARGDARFRQRLADWQSLASRAGARGGVLIADPATPRDRGAAP